MNPSTRAVPAGISTTIFASTSLNEDGSWKALSSMKNSCADLSPTAGQMPRLIGLGYASKLFRNNPLLGDFTHLSDKGSEVAFGTIGDASTAEGMFFETVKRCGRITDSGGVCGVG
jgi:2-oxoisovalerate dehydrogenase E1 component